MVVQSFKGVDSIIEVAIFEWVSICSCGRLLSGIADSLRANGELAVRFRKRRRVKDCTDTVLAAAFAQTETGGRRMSDDVSSNGLGRV